MRAFPGTFATEIAKKTDITPVWVLRIVVNGITYDLSDSVVVFPVGTAGGFTTTLPWIARWGSVRESIAGTLGEMQVSDFDCSVLVDQDNANNIRNLALSYPLESSPAELYLWLAGLTSATPPQKLFVGYIKDIDLPDETTVNLTFEDESTRLQKYIGTRVSSEAYPLCDPDDVGKMIPIVYGTVSKLPARCVDSGWVSTILYDINTVSTTITVTELPTGYTLQYKTIYLEDEQVYVSGVAGKVLTIIRGQNTTTAALHSRGTTAIEKKAAPLVYLVADHAVDTIGTIYARVQGLDIDITADCTKYLTITAGQLNGKYTGKAGFTIPDIATVSQRIQLAIQDNIKITDALHSHMTGATEVPGYINNPTTAMPGVAAFIYPPPQPPHTDSGYWSVVYAVFPDVGTIKTSTITISCQSNPADWKIFLADGPDLKSLTVKATEVFASFYKFSSLNAYNITLTSASDMQLRYVHIAVKVDNTDSYPATFPSGLGPCRITALSRTITSVSGGVLTSGSSGNIGKTGTVTLTGNSVADVAVGDLLLADVSRNISTPFDVIDNFLSTYCNDTSLIQVGTFPTTYSINGAITDYKKAIEWLDYISFQCRAFFRKMAGVSRLIVRDVNPPVTGIIPACCLKDEGIKALSYKKAPISDVINKVKVFYDRDWAATGKQSDAYRKSTSSTDTVSIAIYGEQEQPELFMSDFVTASAMATDLATFYQDFYADRKWRVAFSTYLDNAQYEFGDVVQLGFANDLVGQVVEAGISPGAAGQMDTMNFVVETVIIPIVDATALTTLLGDQLMSINRERIIYV